MTTNILDKVWDGAGETWAWLRGVLLGEWEDHQSVSQIVANALAGFTPGVGSLLTLRDLLAVVVRLAKHPEKREDIEQWILLIAMLLPLILTALGALAVGVGALVGAELGGFLRALALTLVKEGGVALKGLVEFFQHHGYGDVVKALRQVKFAKYKDALVNGLGEQLDKLISLVRSFEKRLRELHPESLPHWIPGRDKLVHALDHCPVLISQLNEVRKAALNMIPKSLIELDRRLGALLAGDIKAATQVTHSVATGQAAPEVARARPDPHQPGIGRNDNPEPGNTRRVRERRLAQFHVQKNQQEFRFVNGKGVPVGAKPYEEGKTVVEYPQLRASDWAEHKGAVKEGYPDLTAADRKGDPTRKYRTFSDLSKADLQPGDRLVRIVAHDAPPYSDTGEFWTRALPENGRQMRSGTAVKEAWNKNGTYVEMTVPPRGHPVWTELGQDPNHPVLKGWEGKASAQRYEYVDPTTGKTVKDDFYLTGGDDQLLMDGKQMEILKKHGFISERKPTNFKDYDADVVNTDGSRGNIVPTGEIIFENVPADQAVLRTNAQAKK